MLWNCNCFRTLPIDSKGRVKAYHIMFKYIQVCIHIIKKHAVAQRRRAHADSSEWPATRQAAYPRQNRARPAAYPQQNRARPANLKQNERPATRQAVYPQKVGCRAESRRGRHCGVVGRRLGAQWRIARLGLVVVNLEKCIISQTHKVPLPRRFRRARIRVHKRVEHAKELCLVCLRMHRPRVGHPHVPVDNMHTSMEERPHRCQQVCIDAGRHMHVGCTKLNLGLDPLVTGPAVHPYVYIYVYVHMIYMYIYMYVYM